MGLLDKLLFRRVDTEIAWLKQLREASETWYNELTNPLLPVLIGEVTENDRSSVERYKKIALELLKEGIVVNAGDVVNNTFLEMGKRGITISSRKKLAPLMEDYVRDGMFVKKVAYGFNAAEAKSKWQHFQMSKDALVAEINNQLKNIG